MNKKRIAFIGVGIFALRGKNPTMPALVRLLNNLSVDYDITVYRLSKGKIDKPSFSVRSLPFSFLPIRINYVMILFLFALDHFRKRFDAINALSAKPAGRMAVTLSKLFNIPVILHLHAAEAIAMPQHNYGDILTPEAKKLTQQICNDVTLTTALSEFHKRAIQEHIQFSRQVEVINHGCDTNLFSFEPKKIGSRLRILFVGYDEAVKCPEEALKVFALISKETNASLTMIGRGLNEKRFASENISLQNVRFQETFTHTEMKDLFHSHDFLLITSFYESQSAVAIEAMSCGVLVCGTHVGVLADLSGIACTTVPVNECESLAREIITLSKDLVRQSQLRANGRQWAQAHNHLWTAKRYSQLFESFN